MSGRFVVWSDKLLTGNADIDGDHRKLVESIDRIAMMDRESPSFLADFSREIKWLLEYSNFHFEREEKALSFSGVDFNTLDSHRREHSFFRSTIEKLDVSIVDYPEETFTKTLPFLGKWLVGHIGTYDRIFERLPRR